MALRKKLLFFLIFSLTYLPWFVFANETIFKGSLSNRYTLRTNGSYNDNDIETLFSLDIGQPYSDRFSGSMQIGGIFDIDSTNTDSPFRSVYDAFGNRAVGRIYYAYFDAKDLGPIYKMRAGRQYHHEFESLYFDGATFETDPAYELSFTAYGGVPVHLFENQLGFDAGDWLAGGALEWNPLTNFKARGDYVHLKDKVTGFRASVGDMEDDLSGLSIWWDVNSHLGFFSRFTSFSDQVRDFQFSTTLKWAEKNLSIRYNFYSLLKAYSFRVIDLDGYGFAGAFEPYYEVSFSISKGFLEHFAIDSGFSSRNLAEEQIASAFNHGFKRAYLSLSSYDSPLKDMSLTLTGDYYHGEDNSLKNNSYGTSFTASQSFLEKHLELTAGTAFYLYRFNTFSGNESNNVQTYFAELEGKILDSIKAKIRYEFENNNFDNFHTIDLGVTWNF